MHRAVLIAVTVVTTSSDAGDFYCEVAHYSDCLRTLIQFHHETVTIQHWCVFCYCCLEKLKKGSNAGHFDNESRVAEKSVLGSTRTPQDQWRTEGVGGYNPPAEIPKAFQNRAKLNPIVKTVKNC